MDLYSGFWQVEMDAKDKEKTAFICPDGLFEFNVLPFGLTNSPATFQRLLNVVLAEHLHDFCLVYIDDIVVISNTIEQHEEHLAKVFTALRKAGLLLKHSKCVFAQKEIKYLGHLVSNEGIRPDPEKIQKIRDFPVPRDKKELMIFLGMGHYYARYFKDFSLRTRPLYGLLKKNVPWSWKEPQQAAFDDIRMALINDALLQFPDPNKEYIVHTDASDFAIGAVLTQEDADGQE